MFYSPAVGLSPLVLLVCGLPEFILFPLGGTGWLEWAGAGYFSSPRSLRL